MERRGGSGGPFGFCRQLAPTDAGRIRGDEEAGEDDDDKDDEDVVAVEEEDDKVELYSDAETSSMVTVIAVVAVRAEEDAAETVESFESARATGAAEAYESGATVEAPEVDDSEAMSSSSAAPAYIGLIPRTSRFGCGCDGGSGTTLIAASCA
jgi:hypothetical protein